MYGYGKYCPVAAATSLVGDFWTPLIVRELLCGTEHFNQLARNVPGISRTLLAGRLRMLERAGALLRERENGGTATRYRLTDAGRDLRQIVDALGAWGTRWGMPDPNATELDPFTVICMLKSSIRGASLPDSRVVIEVVIAGAQETRAWIVCERQQVSMCVDYPGFEVDIFLRADASTVYRIWRQALRASDAIRQRLLLLDGPADLIRALPGWFESRSASAALAATTG